METLTKDEIFVNLVNVMLTLNPNLTALLDTSVNSRIRDILKSFADQLYYNQEQIQTVENNINYDTSTSEALDKHASDKSLLRGGALPSQVTLRIGSSTLPTERVNIPINFYVSTTDATPIIFSTLEASYIDEFTSQDIDGNYTVDITAESTTTGYNTNVYIGTATAIVNPIKGITVAKNITVGTGGRDEESDESLISRLKEAKDESVRGSKSWFITHTKDMFDYVRDVYVTMAYYGNGSILMTVIGFNPLTSQQLQDIEDYYNSDDVSTASGWNVSVSTLSTQSIDITINYVYRYNTSVDYDVIYENTQNYLLTLGVGDDFIYSQYIAYMINNIELLQDLEIVTGGNRLIEIDIDKIANLNNLVINNYVEV